MSSLFAVLASKIVNIPRFRSLKPQFGPIQSIFSGMNSAYFSMKDGSCTSRIVTFPYYVITPTLSALFSAFS